MGNCVGQRRLKSDGSLKKNVPKTPSKENEGKESAANGKQTKLDKTASKDNVNIGKIMTQKDDNLNNSEKGSEEKSQGDNGFERNDNGGENGGSHAEVIEKDSLSHGNGKYEVRTEVTEISKTSWVVIHLDRARDKTLKPDKTSGITNKDGDQKVERQSENIERGNVPSPPEDEKSQDDNSGESESGKIESKNCQVIRKGTNILTKERVIEEEDEINKQAQEKKSNVHRKKIEAYALSLKAVDIILDLEKHLFVEKLSNQNVLLEEIQISGREIDGLIAVTCKRKSSKVLVRFTTDSWKSTKEEEAVPFKILRVGTYQRFFFLIFVPWAKSVEFAIEVITENGMLWDNNNYSNYSVKNVKDGNEAGTLVARFSTQKVVAFADYVKAKSVCLKNASVRNGKAYINIAVKKGSKGAPGVRFTLNNWETFSDVVCSQFKEDGEDDLNHHNFHANFEVQKAAKLVFVIFWKHDGTEDWDNNNGKNYEIQLP